MSESPSEIDEVFDKVNVERGSAALRRLVTCVSVFRSQSAQLRNLAAQNLAPSDDHTEQTPHPS